MRRFGGWWSRQSAGIKATYVTAMSGAIVAVIAACIPVVLAGAPRAAPATTTTTLVTTTTQDPTLLTTPSATETTLSDVETTATEVGPTTSLDPDLPPPPTSSYLSEMDALQYDDGSGSYAMSGKPYDQSVRKFCGANGNASVQTWSTGGYGRLTAVVGIADDDANALGAIARVGIRNQDGTDLITPFDVSLGRHRLIDVDLKGAVQVQITCTGRDSKTGKGRSYFYVVLGNGALHA
jgi:hypothetical protein